MRAKKIDLIISFGSQRREEKKKRWKEAISVPQDLLSSRSETTLAAGELAGVSPASYSAPAHAATTVVTQKLFTLGV